MSKGVIIALHDIPKETTVRRKPGRPRKVHVAVLDQQDYDAGISRLREAHIANGPLVLGNPSSVEVIDQTVHELAVEAAALAFERCQRARSPSAPGARSVAA
jgi:hypothetical protein